MKSLIKLFLFNVMLYSVPLGFAHLDYGYYIATVLLLATAHTALKLYSYPKQLRRNRNVYTSEYNLQNQDLREAYKTAAGMIAAANGFFTMRNGVQVPDTTKIDKTQLTQGYIFTMCDINPQQSILQFPVIDTQQVAGAPVLPIMRLLSMQDSFVISSMSYYLMMYTFTGSQQNPDYTAGNYWTPITFPSTSHNNNSTAFPFMAPGMGMFWNGFLSFTVNKKVVIPYWDTSRHMYIPQQQATQYPAAGGNPTQWPLYQDQFDGSTSSFFPVEPTVVIGGGRQNDIKLNLPANIPATIAPFTYAGYGTSFVMKACLVFRGILAQNSTSVK